MAKVVARREKVKDLESDSVELQTKYSKTTQK